VSGTLGSLLLYDLRGMSVFEEVDADDWQSWIDDNAAIVLDVREPDEWERGTLPEAVLISQGEIVEKVDELDKGTPILCVCRSGNRSSNVAMFLHFNGFQVANLQGGMKALGLQE